MITQEQLKEELRRIIKEENITTPEQLCESSTISSLITNYVYDQMVLISSKVDVLVYDKIMNEYYDELDYYFVNEFEEDEEDYDDECSKSYNEIYEHLNHHVVEEVSIELYHEQSIFLSDTEKLIYEVISEFVPSKIEADKYQKCIEKLVYNGVEYYASCEDAEICYDFGIIDHSHYLDITWSSFNNMFEDVYQEILDRREYEEERDKFISNTEDIDISST